ncbi:MAG: 5-(carboxyamino)imidazole ribonucleotide synthase [Solirubrobacterales bacterium]|nr:5-(carboxyamino)imidazole ribonucleotide synthase [Solirubrobacterales bacterium]
MVGGGQLARMTQQAAVDLDVGLSVLAPSPEEPAVDAGARFVEGAADDPEALRRFADQNDVVTFDHEGVPPEVLAGLEEEGLRFAPPAQAKLFAQDKAVARQRLCEKGFPVPPNLLAGSVEQVAGFGSEHGWPVIAKAPRGGYDGRGVWELASAEEAAPILEGLDGGLLLEPKLELVRELAVITARRRGGETATWPVVETVQRDAMCRELIVPARSDPEVLEEAAALGRSIAEAIGAVGLVAVELFETPDGLFVNELALRPHNSGHFSIEGSDTSQFEQHLRAVLDWPLGSTAPTAPAVVTVNVVGPDDGSDPRDRLEEALGVERAHIHLYGKEARPGRKLGHVTALADTVDEAQGIAMEAVSILEGGA